MLNDVSYYLDLLKNFDLTELAISRNDALERCLVRTTPFMEHFACIMSYVLNGEETTTIEFWAKELINLLNDVLFIKMKSDNKLIPIEFIYDNMLDGKDVYSVLSASEKEGIDKSKVNDLASCYLEFIVLVRDRLMEKRNASEAIRKSLKEIIKTKGEE